ncbi:unnamed protein product [marine sediment metagenome]|uniref:Uncharacterized protein n=1 Tax=marine sediment metagenome TaxID=412755 RepID=X1EVX0_9ZZZZ
MSKPVLQFALLCDEVIKEENTKKLSFIGLFGKINSSVLPIVQNRMYIITRWINITDELEHMQYFKIIREKDNKEIYDSKKNELPFLVKNEKGNHTVVARLNNIVFDPPGSYYIEFYLDDNVQPQRIYIEAVIMKNEVI